MAQDQEQALEILRGQRHNFMNHLQVISGWLQMNKPERAMQYLNRVAARMEEEGQALRRTDSPEMSLFLIDLGLKAEPYGVTLEWRLVGTVDPAALPDAHRRICAALDEAARLPEGQRRLLILLGREITVHRPSTTSEG